MNAREDGKDIPPPPGKTPYVLVLLVGAALIGWGAYGHWQRDREATATLDAIRNLVPRVRTVSAERVDGPVDLTLPGRPAPFSPPPSRRGRRATSRSGTSISAPG